MFDHRAGDVAAGFAQVEEDSGLLGFERADTAGDIVGVVHGEEFNEYWPKYEPGTVIPVATPQGRYTVTSMPTAAASESM